MYTTYFGDEVQDLYNGSSAWLNRAVRSRPRRLAAICRAVGTVFATLKTPSSKTFEQLVAKLTEHYNPEPQEVMQRFRFNSRSRKPGESVAPLPTLPISAVSLNTATFVLRWIKCFVIPSCGE